MGCTRVAIADRPTIAVVSTGDEVISIDAAPLLPTQEVKVVVRRDGQEHTVRYFPAREGSAALGWEWAEREMAQR